MTKPKKRPPTEYWRVPRFSVGSNDHPLVGLRVRAENVFGLTMRRHLGEDDWERLRLEAKWLAAEFLDRYYSGEFGGGP